ncbi:protein CEPU-1 isoform X1 [Nilaparvata lugens]|uniref:protein CEPU-1 isoform X1 n=1 Tax=Nilaparvata lugens TaxID=108931 RepID=UPI00193DF8BB|nr:protein CEPU-1 isoform X1 [Nilaparvata lugens]
MLQQRNSAQMRLPVRLAHSLGLTLLFYLIGLTNGNDTPIFTSRPSIMKASHHDTVQLPCFIDNLGANTVRWWREQELIWDSSDTGLRAPANVRMFATNHTLEVADVSAADSGNYICQVVRPEPWGPLNQIHAIEVQFAPTVTPLPDSGEIEVKLNDEAAFGCLATGMPQPIITWTFQGKKLQLLTNRENISFTVTSKAMEGEYQCIANNGVGEPAVASVFLRIIYPPEVTTEKLWIHTAPGSRIDLSCTVHANPDATVEWYRQDAVIDERPRIMKHRNNDKYSLIIRNVRKEDFGYFTCKAKNSVGTGQQTMHLSGIANPAVLKKTPHQTDEGSFTLVWQVDSYSAIYEYSLLFRIHSGEGKSPNEWTKLVIPADTYSPGPLHSQSYTLTGLKASTIYEATVLSRNPFGWSRPSQILKFTTAGSDVNEDEKKSQEQMEEEKEEIEEGDAIDGETNIQNIISGNLADIVN